MCPLPADVDRTASFAQTALSEKTPGGESAGRLPLPGPTPAGGRAPTDPPHRWPATAMQCAESGTACGSTGTPAQTLPGTLLATDRRFGIARRQFRAIKVFFDVGLALSFRSVFPLCPVSWQSLGELTTR